MSAGSKDLGHKIKEIFDDTVSSVGTRVGRKMAGRVDRQRGKADDIRDRTDETDATMRADASSTADSTRRDVEALDTGTYAELRRRATTGDRLEHDHIPSAAARIRAAELENGGPLSRDEELAIYNGAASVELPTSVHRGTRTYGGSNSQQQISDDASDLAAAAELDYADRRELLIDAGYDPGEVDAAIERIREINRGLGIGE